VKQLFHTEEKEGGEARERECRVLGVYGSLAKVEREERIKALLEEERLQAEQEKEAKVQEEPAQIATAAASSVLNDDLEGESSFIAKDAEDPMLVEENEENEDGEVREEGQGDQDDEGL
jgi:hypothetical protein